MPRPLAATACALVLCTAAGAGTYRGTVKSVDPAKNTIIVTVRDVDRTFRVSDDTRFRRGKKDLPRKLRAKVFAQGPHVVVVTRGKGDQEVVQEVRVRGTKKAPTKLASPGGAP